MFEVRAASAKRFWQIEKKKKCFFTCAVLKKHERVAHTKVAFEYGRGCLYSDKNACGNSKIPRPPQNVTLKVTSAPAKFL